MQVVLYDGSFEGFLSAVFAVYQYKLQTPHICTNRQNNGSLFQKPCMVDTDAAQAKRVLQGLQQKISRQAVHKIYQAFLSEQAGIENTLLQYIQYVFSSAGSVEHNFAHPAVLAIAQTVKKVHREKHRMEAFIRFQKTREGLYFAVAEPDFNVLPLIAPHFTRRYADQQWLIYDTWRKYGIYYNLTECCEVTIHFTEAATDTANTLIYDENEAIYQRLWASYFNSVNIAARKNTRLHVQHVPRRYWKYLTEKQM